MCSLLPTVRTCFQYYSLYALKSPIILRFKHFKGVSLHNIFVCKIFYCRSKWFKEAQGSRIIFTGVQDKLRMYACFSMQLWLRLPRMWSFAGSQTFLFPTYKIKYLVQTFTQLFKYNLNNFPVLQRHSCVQLKYYCVAERSLSSAKLLFQPL